MTVTWSIHCNALLITCTLCEKSKCIPYSPWFFPYWPSRSLQSYPSSLVKGFCHIPCCLLMMLSVHSVSWITKLGCCNIHCHLLLRKYVHVVHSQLNNCTVCHLNYLQICFLQCPYTQTWLRLNCPWLRFSVSHVFCWIWPLRDSGEILAHFNYCSFNIWDVTRSCIMLSIIQIKLPFF